MKEEIETRNVAEMAQSENRQADEDIVITPEMTEAGVKAADLFGYRWGWGDEGSLVGRVFLAMNAVRRVNLLSRERTGETSHNAPRNL